MIDVGEYLRQDTRQSGRVSKPVKYLSNTSPRLWYYTSLFDRMVDCGLPFGHITTPVQLDVM